MQYRPAARALKAASIGRDTGLPYNWACTRSRESVSREMPQKSHVCVVGAGRSGAVTAACLAELGHAVRALDINERLIASLGEGRAPFHEPGLDALLERNLQADRLSFTTLTEKGVADASFVLLCVDTPAQENGEANLSSLWTAAGDVAPLLRDGAIVITRSTVPIGTNARLFDTIRAANASAVFEVVSNPEFLREGHAVDDFLRPDRIIIGARTEEAARTAGRLYEGIETQIVYTDLETAEMVKYAANAYLATSVSFINEIANLCERVGADVSVVAEALKLDKRIGPRAYLAPGIGFGGSCLPKDLRALISTAEEHGGSPALLQAVVRVNELQPRRIIEQMKDTLGDLRGKHVAVLGISFKGGTFDARSSPALAVMKLLVAEGAAVRAFDPLADGTTREQVATGAVASDAYAAAEGASAVVVATDHDEFRTLVPARLAEVMASRVIVDGRNLLDPEAFEQAGFVYMGVGRPSRRE